MELKDIRKMAYDVVFKAKTETLPKNISDKDKLQYYIVRSAYEHCKLYNLDNEEKVRFKETYMTEFNRLINRNEPNDNVIACFNASVQEQAEISKLILPAEKVKLLSRDDLLELVARIRAILQGIIDKCDEELPNFARDGLLPLIKEEETK